MHECLKTIHHKPWCLEYERLRITPETELLYCHANERWETQLRDRLRALVLDAPQDPTEHVRV